MHGSVMGASSSSDMDAGGGEAAAGGGTADEAAEARRLARAGALEEQQRWAAADGTALAGPLRRLALAKLVHARLCSAAQGHPLGDLLSFDIVELVGPRVLTTHVVGPQREGEDAVRAGQGDEVGIGWGATRAYVRSAPLPGAVHSLRVVCDACDQGWGNTGHSRVEVALIRPTREPVPGALGVLARGDTVVRHYPLGSVSHERAGLALECQAAAGEGEDDDAKRAVMPRSLCSEARAGDHFAVVMVSAPYPGFECKMFAASIEATLYC